MGANRWWVAAGFVLIVGCGPRQTSLSPQAAPPRSQGSALATGNGISENGVSENGVSENGVSENGHSENGHSENGHSENGHSENGHSENGHSENGHSENGHSENGHSENGDVLGSFVTSVDFAPVVVPNHGIVLDTALNGAAFGGHDHHTTLAPSDYVGATFVGNQFDGAHTLMRITDHKMADAPNSDLDLYLVQYFDTEGHHPGWKSYCVDGSGNAQYATATSGFWDYTEGTNTGGDKTESTHKFTFACPEGAIYKCIDWGYRPWSTYNGTSLSPYHQACTRMTRADYCGDGTPHTIDGSEIELYDNLGIQVDDEPWVFEAQWAPGGATCIAPGGVEHNGAAVSCYHHLVSNSCTADSPSAMLSSETPTGVRHP